MTIELGHCNQCCEEMAQNMGEAHTKVGCYLNPLVEHAKENLCTNQYKETELPPDFYPVFLSMMSSIKDMKEAGKTWEEIETRVAGELIDSHGRQYYIWHGQKCGHPSGCDEIAVVMFIYETGIIGGCKEHSIPTMEDFLKWI